MNKLCTLLLFFLVLTANTQAQTKRPATKSKAHQSATKPQKMPSSAVTVDTIAMATVPVMLPVAMSDTTKKDTTVVEKVADAVHDTVKAQLKAPIVQIPVTLRSLIIPGVLFAYGAITLNNGRLREINEEAREVVWDGQQHGRPYVEDYLLLAPAAAVYGLNICGIKGQNNFVDRSILYGLSNAIANGFVFGLKRVGIETRPDSSDIYSFPSGHTAEAFVSAEFLHLEYRGRVHWSVIAAGYTVATSVAYLRMYHNKHWLSDVVAGAGVGIASTRFSYYIYPLLKHLIFGSKKVQGAAMIVPTYNNGMVGFAGVLRF